MRALAEQIAVLDGIDTSSLDFDDGRIGQDPASVDQYAEYLMPDVLARQNVIDPSTGANVGGGSSYAPGLPLMPSSVGLANIPGVLPTKRHVIDPSGGANYSGGSSYAAGIPLLGSSVGLAGAANAPLIAGGYGATGLGVSPNAPLLAGGYGAAGFGNTRGSYVDQDLAQAFNSASKPVMPGVISRRNVIDPSGGANYSGGSSYAPGQPLLTSTIGLAGLDQVADKEFLKRLPLRARALFKKAASKGKVSALTSRINMLRKRTMNARTPMARAQAAQAFANTAAQLSRVRATRRAILTRQIVDGVPVTAIAPVSPSSLAGTLLARNIVDGVAVSASQAYSPTMLWK